MAGYVARNLHPGESVDHTGRVAWAAVLGRGIIELIVALVLVVVGGMPRLQNVTLQDLVSDLKPKTAASPTTPQMGWSVSIGQIVVWLALAVLLVALLNLLRGCIFRATAEYAVTNQRVIGKYGLVNQNSVDVRMAAVTGVSTSNSLVGRIFGYGSVWVNSAGGSDQLVSMKDPKAFETAVYNRLNDAAAYPPGARAAVAGPPMFGSSRACPHCGVEPGPGARFCVGCGAPVDVGR